MGLDVSVRGGEEERGVADDNTTSAQQFF